MITVKNSVRAVIACTTILFLQSCDPASTFECSVKNNSSHHITYIVGEMGHALDPGETWTESHNHLGSYQYLKNDYYKNKSYCPCQGSSKIVPADTSLKVAKDISDCNNWEHHDNKMKGLRPGGEFYCHFEITDADFK